MFVVVSFVSVSGRTGNINCETGCKDYSSKCNQTNCKTKWARANCQAKCRTCIPCEDLFVSREQFELQTQSLKHLEEEVKNLTETVELLKLGTKFVHRIDGIALTTGSNKAEIVKGHVKYLFDDDENTCATIQASERAQDRLWLQFPKDTYVDHYKVYVKSNELFERTGSYDFNMALYSDAEATHYDCTYEKTRPAGWRTSRCPSEMKYYPKGYLCISFNKNIEVCSIETYGYFK